MKKLSKNNNGFSHFELVLLVVVVAIIASVGFFVYNKNNNKSKADSIASNASQPVSCTVTGIVSSPSYGTEQSPVVVIYNKSGRAFSGELLVELQLNNNGDGARYNIKTGVINNGLSKSLRLKSFNIPYADGTFANYGPLNTAVGVTYNDPLPPNKRSFSCSTKFTLPIKPEALITVYRYIYNTDPYGRTTWLLGTMGPDAKPASEYQLEKGKEFKAFSESVPDTKPVYYYTKYGTLSATYTLNTDEMAKCEKDNTCSKFDIKFYAYDKPAPGRIPVYAVKTDKYAYRGGYVLSNVIYTADGSEAYSYKNKGWTVTTAFWAQK